MNSDFKTRRCPISKTEKKKGENGPAIINPRGKGQYPWNSGPTPVARGGCRSKAPLLATHPKTKSSTVRHGRTWALHLEGFLLRVFFLDSFYFNGDWSLRTGPSPFPRVNFVCLLLLLFIHLRVLSHQAVVV